MPKKFDLDQWDDFHVSQNNSVSAEDYYSSFLSFIEIKKQLPKQGNSTLVSLFNYVQENKSKALFRKNSSSNYALSILWLSCVSASAKTNLIEMKIPTFKGLEKDDLKELAKLSIDESIINKLPIILAKYGIILIYEEPIASMKLDGCIFKLATGNPVIGISFRYPRIDYFWFTLMHELSHIVLHFDLLDNPILDNLDNTNNNLIERQANKLAKTSFIERHIWRNCTPKYEKTQESIYAFAKEQSIHPAIVAGFLQFETNDYKRYAKITNSINVREMVFNNE